MHYTPNQTTETAFVLYAQPTIALFTLHYAVFSNQARTIPKMKKRFAILAIFFSTLRRTVPAYAITKAVTVIIRCIAETRGNARTSATSAQNSLL